jgi:hypothetical protein
VEHDFEVEPTVAGHRPPVRSAGASAAAAPLRAAAGNAAFTRLVQQVRRSELASQGAGPLDPEIAAAIGTQLGGGSPLAEPVRADMEGHFGVDLGEVRVHSGATELAGAVQAEAFTTGADIFFANSVDPTSGSGRELLAHELTHVVQQATGSAGEAGTVSHPRDPAEEQARDVGRAVANAGSAAQPAAGGLDGGGLPTGSGGPGPVNRAAVDGMPEAGQDEELE